jgi:phosphoribosyl-ATP pyrophosphohydrolase
MKNARIADPKDSEPDPPPGSDAIARLWSALDDHVKLRAPVPERTARLVSAGDRKMAQKLVEEAGEAALAAIVKDRTELVRESADIIYHLTLLWASLGIRPEEIWAEMAEREAAYGLAEKRAKHRRRRSGA